MQSKSEDIVERYIRARNLTEGTRSEYIETAHKWNTSNGVSPIQDLDKRTGRELLEWVHEHSIENGGKSPGRTTNKACAQLRA
ncbi:hypothetical protein AB1L42_23840, partial [Thalassoglobus sp. JC818]|uniref:hypothetical protein n=1 Tax=Thalassoglobus sp. JC818 TaxID=3232136 RepID=UPI00345A4AFB